MDISVIIPCLNEKDTIGICVSKSIEQIKNNKFEGEVIVADNGSNDGSIKIALEKGARIINVKKKGYGRALQEGIAGAKGEYIFMADADNSYDFNKINDFYNKIKEGYDMVNGCRFPKNGGQIEKKAMPLSHRYIGNPFFSWMAKKIYRINANDIYCGMKIFNRNFFNKLDFFFFGMVFNVELLIKFHLTGAKITELPITLHKDGRVNTQKHLKTISDGLSTLKFFLVFCPKLLYFVPAVIIVFCGIVNLVLNLNNLTDTSLNVSLGIFFTSALASIQLAILGLYTHLIARSMHLTNNSPMIDNFFRIFTIKRSLFLSILILSLAALLQLTNFLNFDRDTLNLSTLFLCLTSVTIFFNSIFVSLLSINQRN